MYFDTNQLNEDAKTNCDNLSTSNTMEDTSGSEEDEFIDVETILPHTSSFCWAQVLKFRIWNANE